MVLDGVVSSPHRRSPSFRKIARDDVLSCSALVQRHRFLLSALALLAFLCTIYLYFAVTLGSDTSCSRLKGVQKESCLAHVRSTVSNGKLKMF